MSALFLSKMLTSQRKLGWTWHIFCLEVDTSGRPESFLDSEMFFTFLKQLMRLDIVLPFGTKYRDSTSQDKRLGARGTRAQHVWRQHPEKKLASCPQHCLLVGSCPPLTTVHRLCPHSRDSVKDSLGREPCRQP